MRRDEAGDALNARPARHCSLAVWQRRAHQGCQRLPQIVGTRIVATGQDD